MRRPCQIYIGFDAREAAAFAVARHSIMRRLTQQIPVHGLVLDYLKKAGLYYRPTTTKVSSEGHRRLWDEISAHEMSTEFAISRFLVPHIVRSIKRSINNPHAGLALFMDCDVLIRFNLCRLFDDIQNRPAKAVWVVKHNHQPSAELKMDGQKQTAYARKNWSSVMLFDCDHPANSALTPAVVNELPGRDLHGFCWLDNKDIGELGPEWNWLAGESAPLDEPKIVHHTLGSPCMAGYENVPFADEWREQLNEWAL